MISIQEIKKVKKQYLIITATETLTVYEDVIIEFRLLSKRDIEDDLYQEIKKYARYIDGYYEALKYLKRSRTSYEVKMHLKSLGMYDERIMERLIRNRLLDDKNYAEMYLSYQKRINKKGPLLIKKELSEKGLDMEILDTLDYGDEEENINKLAEKYLLNHRNKSGYALKKGLDAFLYQKGYTCHYEGIIMVDEGPLIAKELERLLKKYAHLDKYQLQQKLYTALLSKGFSSQEIKKQIEIHK